MRRYLIALGAGAGLMVTSGGAAQPATATVTGGPSAPGTRVMAKPLSGTPHFSVKNANPVQQVRQLVQCGSTMYAVGSFSQILQRNHVFERHNVFSFRATPPFRVRPWHPNVRGTVNSITFRVGRCSHAYIGGNFTSVNGHRARKIAEINTRTGGLVKRFGHNASAQIETLQAVNGRILVGGDYRSINGSSANPYMTGLNPTTGRDNGFVHLRIGGHIRFPGVVGNLTHVYNQALSHNRKLDLVIGDFASVRGLKRQQMFMINVGGAKAKLTGWRSPAFNGHCDVHEPLYVRAASWSPSDGRIYIATTGRFTHGSSPQISANRALRRRGGVSGCRKIGLSDLEELHRLRLALQHSGRRQHRLLRRSRPLVDEPSRLQLQGPRRYHSQRNGGTFSYQRPPAHQQIPHRPGTTRDPAGTAPTTCCAPTLASGSPATTLATARRVASHRGSLASVFCRIGDGSPVRCHLYADRPLRFVADRDILFGGR